MGSVESHMGSVESHHALRQPGRPTFIRREGLGSAPEGGGARREWPYAGAVRAHRQGFDSPLGVPAPCWAPPATWSTPHRMAASDLGTHTPTILECLGSIELMRLVTDLVENGDALCAALACTAMRDAIWARAPRAEEAEYTAREHV